MAYQLKFHIFNLYLHVEYILYNRCWYSYYYVGVIMPPNLTFFFISFASSCRVFPFQSFLNVIYIYNSIMYIH